MFKYFKKWIFIALIYTVTISSFSIALSRYTYTTDFPCFYTTAKTILNNDILTNEIYFHSDEKRAYVPEIIEPWKRLDFNYSKVIAILMSPLGLLPYYWAKAFLIFLNISAYLGSTLILVNIFNIEEKFRPIVFSLTFLWLPFIEDIRFAQIDGIILLLITLSLWLTKNEKFSWSGFFIGLSILTKIYPFAIALALGLKRSKIFLASLSVFLVSFFIPGSIYWLKYIPNLGISGFIDSHRYYIFYIILASIIPLTTAATIFLSKDFDYLKFYAILVPATFLAAPFLEYYHLTLMVLSFIYLFSCFMNLSLFSRFLSILSLCLVFSSTKVQPPPPTYIGIFLCWFVILTKDLNYRFLSFSKKAPIPDNFDDFQVQKLP